MLVEEVQERLCGPQDFFYIKGKAESPEGTAHSGKSIVSICFLRQLSHSAVRISPFSQVGKETSNSIPVTISKTAEQKSLVGNLRSCLTFD